MAKLGEFDRIAQKLAPLTVGYDGALGLTDDAAFLEPAPSGWDVVVSTDTVVAGVHFFADDPAETVAKKALRMNLSDCAGMGATPAHYTLNLCLPESIGGVDADTWIDGFTHGLAEDQQGFDVVLIGGDSVSTSGPAVITVTIFGHVPTGKALLRSAAQPGDDIWVSGTLGDASLGLLLRRDPALPVPDSARQHLADRYLLPQPRTALGRELAGLAHAALDVSDGLIQDLGHIATASAAQLRVERDAIPVSPAARSLETVCEDWIERVVAGGDDYEIAFTAPADVAGDIRRAAEGQGVLVTRIGTVCETSENWGGGVVLLDPNGDTVPLGRTGWRHA